MGDPWKWASYLGAIRSLRDLDSLGSPCLWVPVIWGPLQESSKGSRSFQDGVSMYWEFGGP